MINELLFVYGSLLNADNEFAAYLNSNAVLLGTGIFKGKLYDIGEYPGAVIDPDGNYKISGNIYKLNNPQAALKILDDYEGFGDKQEHPNLFVRKSLPVETINGTVYCWVYLYNLPVDDLKQITSGNYSDHLNKKSDEF
jgi:gamma-glutamylcyclotransferase (GGCT)/AIG2-like uncharacterized protein YtfP